MARHSGMDAGIQRPWMANLNLRRAFAVGLKFHVLVTGFRHPCRNDGVLAKMRIADQITSDVENAALLWINPNRP